MQFYTYLSILLFSLIGLLYFDYKKKFVIFTKNGSSIRDIIFASLLFLIIDIVGVVNGIFYSNRKYIVGVDVFPGVPIEEIFFLLLFSYFSLIVWRFFK
jgi:lycopene cyclase domain-containing protein